MTMNLKGVTSCLGYAQDDTISAASYLPSIPTKDPVTGEAMKPTIATMARRRQRLSACFCRQKRRSFMTVISTRSSLSKPRPARC